MTTGYAAPYLFGDSDIAARGLQVLAEVFADSTDAAQRNRGITSSPTRRIDSMMRACGRSPILI